MTQVALTAKIATEGAGKAAAELDKFAKSAKKADKEAEDLAANKAFRKDFSKSLGSGLKTVATAAVTFVSAIGAVAIAAASAEDEIADLADRAGISVDRFKELAFAFKTVGISQEGMTENIRKVSNEMGQFIQTGGGGFKAVFDALKGKVDLTAESLANLSGDQILIKVKKAMEDANIPIKTQGNLLDGLAKGVGKLAPLLADNAAKLNAATTEYNKYNNAIKLSGKDSAALGEVADKFDLLQTTMKNAATYMVSQFAPQIKAVIDWMLTNVPKATVAITTLMQAFTKDSEKTSKNAIGLAMADTARRIELLDKQIDEFNKTGKVTIEGQFFDTTKTGDDAIAFIEDVMERSDKATAHLKMLQKQMADIVNAKPTEDIQKVEPLGPTDEQKKEFEARKKAAEDFLAQVNLMGRSELELITINEEEKLKQLDEMNLKSLGLADKYEAAKTQIILDAQNARDVVQEKWQDEQLKNDEEFARQRAEASDFVASLKRDNMNEQQLIDDDYSRRLQMLNEYFPEAMRQEEEYQEGLTAMRKKHIDERNAYEESQRQLLLTSGESLFGDLANMTEAFGKKQTGTYRALFAVSKAFALANATMNLSSAISSAYADWSSLTVAEKFAKAAAIGAAAGQMVSNIANIKAPREQGGQFAAGDTRMVGERGPELVKFGSGGRIANANDTANMMNRAPNITFINQTSARIDQTDVQTKDNGDMVIIAREVLKREVSNPNSEFNKTFDRTRQSQRRLG